MSCCEDQSKDRAGSSGPCPCWAFSWASFCWPLSGLSLCFIGFSLAAGFWSAFDLWPDRQLLLRCLQKFGIHSPDMHDRGMLNGSSSIFLFFSSNTLQTVVCLCRFLELGVPPQAHAYISEHFLNGKTPFQDMLHSRIWSSASLCTAERSWILCFCHAKVGVVQEEMFFSYWCAHMTLNPWCHGHGLLRFFYLFLGHGCLGPSPQVVHQSGCVLDLQTIILRRRRLRLGICLFGFEVFSTLKPFFVVVDFSQVLWRRLCINSVVTQFTNCCFCKFARDGIADFSGRAMFR